MPTPRSKSSSWEYWKPSLPEHLFRIHIFRMMPGNELFWACSSRTHTESRRAPLPSPAPVPQNFGSNMKSQLDDILSRTIRPQSAHADKVAGR